MFDLRKVISFPYINFKFFIIILLIACISLISNSFILISFFLMIFVTFSFIALKYKKELKNYDSNFWTKLLKYTGVFLITSFIFLLFQIISILIGLIPTFVFSSEMLLSTFSTFNFSITSFFLIVFVFVAIFIGFLKIIGLIRYIKTNKFEVIFDFRNNLKIIFSKNFLVSFLYLIGYVLMYAFFVLAISGILSLFGLYNLTNILIRVIALVVIYFFITGIYAAFIEVIEDYKIK